MTSRLTIIIPHLDRTDFLRKALVAATNQTEVYIAEDRSVRQRKFPAKVLVADQGKTPETAALMAEYADDPLVMHCPTDATCLWENWTRGMELAIADGAEFVAPFQDDDDIHCKYASRIVESFDKFPEANTWTARLNCSNEFKLALWCSANGPVVPMNTLENLQVQCPGSLATPYAYFSSLALSPAVAFRCGQDLIDSLREQIYDIDLFVERTILASMGSRAPIICDPVMIGYWKHHGGNESYKQRKFQAEQTPKFLSWLDDCMDRTEGWEETLNAWANVVPNLFLEAFIHSMNGMESRYVCKVADILRKNMGDEGPELVSDGTPVNIVGGNPVPVEHAPVMV